MLLALDLDNTILNFHSHNELYTGKFKLRAGQATPEHALELLKVKSLEDQKPFKHAPEMLALIQNALLEGHYVAIVSYTFFPEIIPTWLEKLGLTKKELNKIYIRGGLPSTGDQEKFGKLMHIEDALVNFGYEKRNHDKALLLDDSYQNCMLAERQGFEAVLVPFEYEPEYMGYFDEAKIILHKSKITCSYLPNYLSNSSDATMDIPLNVVANEIDPNLTRPHW